MTKRQVKAPVETPREWGARQAQAAPPWSDTAWRRACASLGLKIGDKT